MKIFETVRKHYAILGISPSNQWSQNRPFDGKILLGFLLFGCNLASQTVYIYRVADDFKEYMMCICSISATFTMFVCFAAVFYRKAQLFECFGNMEKSIDARKTVWSHHYCARLNGQFQAQNILNILIYLDSKDAETKAIALKNIQRVERLSEITFTVVMKVIVQCMALPKCIVSFGVYFFTDSGSDSFQLPFPLW